jgi:hypothetical protein
MSIDPEVKAELIERFIKEVWSLNRSGNSEHAASELILAVTRETMFEGGPVTLEIIRDKYKEYLKYMRGVNSERKPGYQSKIEDIATFIMRKRYNEDFRPDPDTNLDLYLYGE